MIHTIIVPLTKSPLPREGRIGADKKQDWYKGVVLAAVLVRQSASNIVAIISDFQVPGEMPDAVLYEQTLIQLGVRDESLYLIQEESETIGQIERALKLGEQMRKNVIFVSSALHSPRVWWLTRKNKNVSRRIVFGRPRPKEAITDLILMFLFPFIDILGFRQRFLGYTKRRRATGTI